MPRKKKQPSVDTQKNFDEKTSKLANKTIEEQKPKRNIRRKNITKGGPPQNPKPLRQLHKYDNTDYAIFPLYKSYFNSENDKNAYHAGSIIGRALVDFENRMDTYMNIMTEGEAKDKIKETIADDLRLLIKKVKKL
jgi:hypothetical protein|tara:strand:- start:270 stop:677 length:408 start_codon:yes stop_codon:yes gene_type:complete